MTWNVAASGDVPVDQQAAFSEEVVSLFKKYAGDVHAFFFQHPGGTVQTKDLTSIATSGASEPVQGGGETGASSPAPTPAQPTSEPATGGKTEQTHATVTQESPPPTPPTIDLGKVATAMQEGASTSGVPNDTVQTEVDKLKADVADLKSGLDAILKAVTGQ